MERDCESELSKLNIEQNACIYHFGASVIHGQRSNILRLRFFNPCYIFLYYFQFDPISLFNGAALYIGREKKGHEGVKGTPLEDCAGTVVHDHDRTFYSYGIR